MLLFSFKKQSASTLLHKTQRDVFNEDSVVGSETFFGMEISRRELLQPYHLLLAAYNTHYLIQMSEQKRKRFIDWICIDMKLKTFCLRRCFKDYCELHKFFS